MFHGDNPMGSASCIVPTTLPEPSSISNAGSLALTEALTSAISGRDASGRGARNHSAAPRTGLGQRLCALGLVDLRVDAGAICGKTKNPGAALRGFSFLRYLENDSRTKSMEAAQQPYDQDDRQGNTDQPQQQSTSHGASPLQRLAGKTPWAGESSVGGTSR